MKVFNEMRNVGKVKYLINYHDGKKTHDDGSPFFDVATFSNQVERNLFVGALLSQGYLEQKYSAQYH